MEIDKRKNYYLTLDTETANGLDDPLVYDIGGAIHDKKGKIYESFSFIVYDIFYEERELMKSAYYNWKIPNYERDIKNKTRTIKRFATIKWYINDLCKKYNVKAIIAHNARFDYNALNTTQRYLTCSKFRYFLPYGIPIWDTLAMVKSTVANQKAYINWCRANDHMRSNNIPRMTAEVLIRYLLRNDQFMESHTALEDVMDEITIFVWCMRQHKKIKVSPWRERA